MSHCLHSHNFSFFSIRTVWIINCTHFTRCFKDREKNALFPLLPFVLSVSLIHSAACKMHIFLYRNSMHIAYQIGMCNVYSCICVYAIHYFALDWNVCTQIFNGRMSLLQTHAMRKRQRQRVIERRCLCLCFALASNIAYNIIYTHAHKLTSTFTYAICIHSTHIIISHAIAMIVSVFFISLVFACESMYYVSVGLWDIKDKSKCQTRYRALKERREKLKNAARVRAKFYSAKIVFFFFFNANANSALRWFTQQKE